MILLTSQQRKNYIQEIWLLGVSEFLSQIRNIWGSRLGFCLPKAYFQPKLGIRIESKMPNKADPEQNVGQPAWLEHRSQVPKQRGWAQVRVCGKDDRVRGLRVEVRRVTLGSPTGLSQTTASWLWVEKSFKLVQLHLRKKLKQVKQKQQSKT